MDEHAIEPIPNPTEFGPLTREQFVAAFDAVMEADGQRIPDDRLQPFGVTWEKDDGSVIELELSGHLMHRPLLIARDYFGAQVKAFQNFLLRFGAFTELIDTNALLDWAREIPEKRGAEIFPAVLYACAEVRLTEDGVFPVAEFLQKTQQIIDEEFYDHKWQSIGDIDN